MVSSSNSRTGISVSRPCGQPEPAGPGASTAATKTIENSVRPSVAAAGSDWDPRGVRRIRSDRRSLKPPAFGPIIAAPLLSAGLLGSVLLSRNSQAVKPIAPLLQARRGIIVGSPLVSAFQGIAGRCFRVEPWFEAGAEARYDD
jgi:hypothetical protein